MYTCAARTRMLIRAILSLVYIQAEYEYTSDRALTRERVQQCTVQQSKHLVALQEVLEADADRLDRLRLRVQLRLLHHHTGARVQRVARIMQRAAARICTRTRIRDGRDADCGEADAAHRRVEAEDREGGQAGARGIVCASLGRHRETRAPAAHRAAPAVRVPAPVHWRLYTRCHIKRGVTVHKIHMNNIQNVEEIQIQET